ncbi:MAG: 50S ribosomal protein L6 [Candidatus Taylorbacteria bacterium RIFOXYD2_FULL_36_9]|uniref:50S ribosomal protein L6 n=1 Tax=Candidatus Taylorbacteria bacterium RIFOXYD2_FULL_36_9 TaxID=1802338 RepID=A0A1G2PCF8_9BACT|nr:MAG: 50S ribosomal protein L6 [Candidatus Taylorbacteria bacterium RIFOXYD2_FULL_36_9]
MSRIGKKIITIPAKTEVNVTGDSVMVKGPLGELTKSFRPGIKIEVIDGKVSFAPVAKNPNVTINSLWGTVSSEVNNMILGVNKAYEKKLIVEGIGFKADVVGTNLVFKLGFSHPVTIAIPKNLKIISEKNIITISGIDKEFVGRYVAELRALKKPEPYKGKGIRYEKEVIKRKEGKKTV